MSNIYKSLFLAVSLLGFLSQAQAMDAPENSALSFPKAAPKKITETVNFDEKDLVASTTSIGPKLNADRLKEVTYGVKTITFKHIDFNLGMMIQVVDTIVGIHKQTVAPENQLNYLSFTKCPTKATSLEHLVFERCAVNDPAMRYQINATLRPYLQEFFFPRGVRIVVGPYEGGAAGFSAQDWKKGSQDFTDLLQDIFITSNPAPKGLIVTIERND